MNFFNDNNVQGSRNAISGDRGSLAFSDLLVFRMFLLEIGTRVHDLVSAAFAGILTKFLQASYWWLTYLWIQNYGFERIQETEALEASRQNKQKQHNHGADARKQSYLSGRTQQYPASSSCKFKLKTTNHQQIQVQHFAVLALRTSSPTMRSNRWYPFR